MSDDPHRPYSTEELQALKENGFNPAYLAHVHQASRLVASCLSLCSAIRSAYHALVSSSSSSGGHVPAIADCGSVVREGGPLLHFSKIAAYDFSARLR